MKRKFIAILMVGVMGMSMVGCNTSDKQDIQQNQDITNQEKGLNRFEADGVEFELPLKWAQKQKNIDILGWDTRENITGQLIFHFISDETKDKMKKLDQQLEQISETDQAKMEQVQLDYMAAIEEYKEICSVVTIDTSKAVGEVQHQLFTEYTYKDLIGTVDQFEMYLLYNDSYDESGLSEQSKKDFNEICRDIENFKNNIKVFKPIFKIEELNKHNQFQFETTTLQGEKVDSSIFEDYKMTMVNVWATSCGPCITEMPYLQELYEEFKPESVNIIGIVSDTPSLDNEELAKEILEKKGAKFTNIMPNEMMQNGILKDLPGVPTTFFVDHEGNILGEFVSGARSKAEYSQEIKERLENIK